MIRAWRTAPAWVLWSLAGISMVSTATIVAAMRHTSPTFDELTTMAVPAREMVTGRWDIMENYPPVTQYMFGIPALLSRPTFPQEQADGVVPHRYAYAQTFLYKSGNDPEVIAFRVRLVSAACALLLILLTFAVGSHYFGYAAGLAGASLVAFLPDVLAHGGIAYNDIVLAAAFLGTLWALDSAVRRPRIATAILAGTLVSITVAVKHSGLIFGPIAIALLLVEAVSRPDRRSWLPRIGTTVIVAVLAGYLVQVALYRGDFSLEIFRAAAVGARAHVEGGHGVPTYLLGRFSNDAWWYFYPVAFLYKTSVALHILLLLSLAGAVRVLQHYLADVAPSAGENSGNRLRGMVRLLLQAPARAPLIAFLIFSYVLITANLAIGFRYALPVLPLICILGGAGVMVIWRTASRLLRSGVVVLVAWSAISALSYYPHFIAYTSEYQPEPDLGYHVLVDSSLDWGQGLLELRDFMRREEIGSIYLSYFGSALPEGYGIAYLPLPSFFPLPAGPPVAGEPEFAAISATNLVGHYFQGDPFARLRSTRPYAVLAHSIFIYKLGS